MASLAKVVALAQQGSLDTEGPLPDQKKVQALGMGTAYDACASTSSPRKTQGGLGTVLRAGICHSFTPDGRCVSLFKTLFTNACTHACSYCPNATCSLRKEVFSYTPEELAKTTIALYQGNYIEGLFLSSGVCGNEDWTMEGMLESVRLLRSRHNFQGYIHLKILPGCSRDHIKEAMELSDRVSINVETVSHSRMAEISSTKDFEIDIMRRQQYIRDLMGRGKMAAGHTTQMVVGAAGESDLEIFQRAAAEYHQMKAKRVYYSAFSPVNGTRFAGRMRQPLWRENRLYQLDWLHRVYKFGRSQLALVFNEQGFLPNCDPKITLARELLGKPIDPNSADYSEMILVPGIGPRSAQRIVGARKRKPINSRVQLARLGVVLKRALPFLKIGGSYQGTLFRWFV